MQLAREGEGPVPGTNTPALPTPCPWAGGPGSEDALAPHPGLLDDEGAAVQLVHQEGQDGSFLLRGQCLEGLGPQPITQVLACPVRRQEAAQDLRDGVTVQADLRHLFPQDLQGLGRAEQGGSGNQLLPHRAVLEEEKKQEGEDTSTPWLGKPGQEQEPEWEQAQGCPRQLGRARQGQAALPACHGPTPAQQDKGAPQRLPGARGQLGTERGCRRLQQEQHLPNLGSPILNLQQPGSRGR